jgi:hypothetical protein
MTMSKVYVAWAVWSLAGGFSASGADADAATSTKKMNMKQSMEKQTKQTPTIATLRTEG